VSFSDSATWAGDARRPLVRLPLDMADFGRRGFRTDLPAARACLETHARAFLTGFNIASAHWRDPHAALAAVPDEERGFSYEGAGMFARMRDVATLGRAKAFDRLLAGPGAGYSHLVHVGAGWSFAVLRMRLPVPLPHTPLLRWLALDGAGFAEAYFGGLRVLGRRCRGAIGQSDEVRLAGCGRALWFIESADPAGVARVIFGAPPAARPALWSGVGLACGYAGAIDDAGRARLIELSGPHRSHCAQGVVFAAGARVRSGIVPEHTRRICEQLLGVTAEHAAAWTDTASEGLTSSRHIDAYLDWKARLRDLVTPIVSG
jgi:enediyne biosynthesis protein E3